MEELDNTVDIKLRLFGGFVFKKRKGSQYQVYEAGFVYWRLGVPVSFISVNHLRFLCGEGFRDKGWEVPYIYNIWYKEKGHTWMTGKREIVTEEDVKGFIEATHSDGHLELYCTVAQQEPGLNDPVPTESPQQEPGLNDPVLTESPQQEPGLNDPIPTESPQPNQKNSPPQSRPAKHTPKKASTIVVRRSPRFSSICEKKVGCSVKGAGNRGIDKGKGKVTEEVELKSSRVTLEGKGKGKCQRKLFIGEESDSGSSSEDLSDIDIDWVPGEEEEGDYEEDGWDQGHGEIQGAVERSLALVQHPGGSFQGTERSDEKWHQLGKDLGVDELELKKEGSDEDELRSLHGSDEEEDDSPWFREETDFKKPIVLAKKQKFTNILVLRRALRTHAIENRYEFYYLHNNKEKLSTFCRRRCDCEWDPKRSKLPKCTCSEEVRRCNYKVIARPLFKSSVWQIQDLFLQHKCMRSNMNANVTAEYLAEKYVEEWRSNPSWKIRSFRDKVLSDLGIKIGYYMAWLARARAKFLIYGSASEQYARVWDYGKAMLKYNPGSVVNVVVDQLDRPEPPLFLRMFVCLSPLVRGFLKGCRPLIGVDGCHLKGSYPGQILVAVGKDGNNSIYPFAWATVEVENKETWCWFLECLKQSLDDLAMGGGFTYMSDRQKGLLEAFDEMVPEAEKRFCVRHIWANFKLQFTGSTFKELFWSAARATTLGDFEIAMESIKFLSEDAYEYLDNIPACHWSRHAFSTSCKSNMLLNNMCETFNACIREARDKPILTQMEWLRRYLMKRHNAKWEAVQKMEGRVMPYVTKLFDRMEGVARHCIVQVSRGDTFEVELNGDYVTVDLQQRSCTCFHWQLTGLPCVHGFACILDKRADPEQYVDHYYTRDMYIQAYDLPVQPMPGPKHWEKIQMREPLPPPVRVMPGRPKSKKRKKERGEGASEPAEGTSQRRQKRCQRCAQFGHYAKTCHNVEAKPEPSSQPKPKGKAVVNTPWVVEQRRLKVARALGKTAAGAGPNSIANRRFPQEEAAKKKAAEAAAAASQAAGASQATAASGAGATTSATVTTTAPARPITRSSAAAEPYICSQASTTTTAKKAPPTTSKKAGRPKTTATKSKN